MPVKVLVVDDEESIRDSLREFLDGEGITTSPRTVSGRWSFQEPGRDLVFLDIKMPGMDA